MVETPRYELSERDEHMAQVISDLLGKWKAAQKPDLYCAREVVRFIRMNSDLDGGLL